MTGNGGPDIGRGGLDVLHGLPGGYVLHDHLQGGHIRDQRLHDLLNKYCLPIEYIEARPRHFGVNAQHHPNTRHLAQRRVHLLHVGNPKIAVRRGSRRIILRREHHPARVCLFNFLQGGSIRQIPEPRVRPR